MSPRWLFLFFWTRFLETVHNIFNSLHENLQSSIEMNENELPLLDILVIKEGMKITTGLFYKNIDSHQYLIFDSCHPSHTKRNIPFNMARQICFIVVYEEWRNTRLSELKFFFLPEKNILHNALNLQYVRRKKLELQKQDLFNNVRKATTEKFLLCSPTTQ